MNDLPKRTKKTNLDIDSLMLLDFLAINGNCNIKFLKKDSYPLHMNCIYSHKVSDDHLDEKMERLILSGLVDKIVDDTIDVDQNIRNQEYIYSITKKGGRLWETEREPIWDRYCSDSSYQDDLDKNIQYFDLDCLKKDIGYQFSKCALDCGLYQYDPNELKLADSNSCLIPWREFTKTYTWRALLIESEIFNVDWDYYERHRTWWRNLKELQKYI